MTWVQAPHRLHTIHVTHPMMSGLLAVVASAHGGELPPEFKAYERWCE